MRVCSAIFFKVLLNRKIQTGLLPTLKGEAFSCDTIIRIASVAFPEKQEIIVATSSIHGVTL